MRRIAGNIRVDDGGEFGSVVVHEDRLAQRAIRRIANPIARIGSRIDRDQLRLRRRADREQERQCKEKSVPVHETSSAWHEAILDVTQDGAAFCHPQRRRSKRVSRDRSPHARQDVECWQPGGRGSRLEPALQLAAIVAHAAQVDQVVVHGVVVKDRRAAAGDRCSVHITTGCDSATEATGGRGRG